MSRRASRSAPPRPWSARSATRAGSTRCRPPRPGRRLRGPGPHRHVGEPRSDATFTFSTTHTYGDNGAWPVKVCAADDDTATCRTLSATVTNVSPTAVIDTTGTVLVNGVPPVIAHAGTNVDFKVRVTDPGSDDLAVTWDWGTAAHPR